MRRRRESAGIPHPGLIDRLPPHSIESEQALLGCVMLDAKQTLPIVRAAIGRTDEFFYDLRHSAIFDACCALEDAMVPIDLVTIQERLKAQNQLEPVGGIPYLSALPEATPSAANLTYYLEILEEKATLRRLIRAATEAVSAAYEGGDTEAILSAAETAILKVRRQRAQKNKTMRENVHEAMTEIEMLHERQGAIGGLSTGLVDLDKLSDGLHPGEMVVIAGFPGSGKSAIAMNIVDHQAVECGNPVGVFSLEMTAKRLAMRLIASRSRVNLRNIRDGFLAERDLPKLTGAAGKLANSNIFIREISDMTISQVRAEGRRMVQQHGIKMIVIDYLQLLTAPGRKDQNREQEVATISRGVKNMAGELGIPVIALSQLNDDGKLRESRAIGQDADTVWTLKVVAQDDQANGYDCEAVPVDIDIRKQRDGQAPAIVNLTFFKGYTRFESAARVMDAPEPNQREFANYDQG